MYSAIVLIIMIILIWCRHFYNVSRCEQALSEMDCREVTDEDNDILYDEEGNRRKCAYSSKKIKVGHKIAMYEWYDERKKTGKI